MSEDPFISRVVVNSSKEKQTQGKSTSQPSVNTSQNSDAIKSTFPEKTKPGQPRGGTKHGDGNGYNITFSSSTGLQDLESIRKILNESLQGGQESIDQLSRKVQELIEGKEKDTLLIQQLKNETEELSRLLKEEKETNEKHRTSQAQKELERKDKEITDLRKETTELKQETEKLREEVEKLRTSKCLSRTAGEKLTHSNPDITDLSDPNRPQKLCEKFNSLYDNLWTDASEHVSKSGTFEKKCAGKLVEILKQCWDFCCACADRQFEILQKKLLIPEEISEEETRPVIKFQIIPWDDGGQISIVTMKSYILDNVIKDLGIEFSEIEELKTRYRDDLNRLRREHYYNEMNNYEQELTARYLSQTGDVNLQTELERIKENDRRLQQTLNDMIEDREKLQQAYQQICKENRELGLRTNDVNQQLQDSNAKILRLQQTLYDMRKDKEKLQQENQQICQENMKLHQQANDVDQQLQESNAEIHRLQEDIQKFVSTNDKEKKIDKLRNVYLEGVFELEKVKNKMERLIKKAPDVLPEEYLRKTLRKCQAINRRSKLIKTLMKSQGNENHVPENECDEINRQENTSSSDEDETFEDQDCRNEISSSMKMNKMETHTTVYNISTSNVNLNTHCAVNQCDGVLSVEPGDPGLPMLTENES